MDYGHPSAYPGSYLVRHHPSKPGTSAFHLSLESALYALAQLFLPSSFFPDTRATTQISELVKRHILLGLHLRL